MQIKTGDYAFTTTRPVPAVIRAGGVLVQLVEIPGLLSGAHEDRGGGRALLGVLRDANAMVLCHDSSQPGSQLRSLREELRAAAIDLPAIVAATKADDARPGALAALRRETRDLETIAVSVLDDASLDALRDAIWRLTGLTRVFLVHEGTTDPDPQTGQLTTVFDELPPLPFEKFTLALRGGDHAVLVNPPDCGTHTLIGWPLLVHSGMHAL